MARRGNPNIRELQKKNAFTPEKAKAAAEKSHEAKRRNYSMFRSLRRLADDTAPVAMLPDGVIKFWNSHGIAKDMITPIMAEITPIYAAAINGGDFDTLERIYKLLGLTFDSVRDQNIKVAFENELKADVNGKIEINIVEKKPEPLED